MFADTNYTIVKSNLVRWNNGRPVNWNNHKLRLSMLIPNGIDPSFCKGQLRDLKCAIREILDPFTGYKGWDKKAPIGAVIVSELCDFVSIMSSCFAYGTMYDIKRGGKYYEEYQKPLIEIGVPQKIIETEFDKLLSIMGNYFDNCTNLVQNVHTDFEGCSYNTLNAKSVKVNFKIVE